MHWPKLGFNGPVHQLTLNALPDRIRQRLGSQPTVQDVLALPAGQEIWERYGSSVEMEMHIDDPQAVKILEKHLGRSRNRKPQPESMQKPAGQERCQARAGELDAVISQAWPENQDGSGFSLLRNLKR